MALVGVKSWSDAHKGLPVYVKVEVGSVFLRPQRRAWPLPQAQGSPFLAALKQGQAGRERGVEGSEEPGGSHSRGKSEVA